MHHKPWAICGFFFSVKKNKLFLILENIPNVPGDLINQTCLEQQVSVWQQAVTDVVLIGPHRHVGAHTQRSQHLQDLESQPHTVTAQ